MMSDSIQSYTASPATIILTTVLLVLFFLAFFSLYLCRCVLYWLNLRRTHGVDESTMKKFPTFTYSQVKDLRLDKSNLECAICLSEFLDDDLLRLLTTCRHVFHQKCIDVWLESNNTCPVCRGSLDEPGKSPALTEGATNGNQEMGDSFSITIEDEDGGRHVGPGAAPPPSIINLAEQSDRKKQYWVKQFWRSHSTGHSVLRGRNIEEERYVLRLPQHSQTKLLGKQIWTRSRTTFRDFESRKYVGFEEVSNIRDRETNIV